MPGLLPEEMLYEGSGNEESLTHHSRGHSHISTNISNHSLSVAFDLIFASAAQVSVYIWTN